MKMIPLRPILAIVGCRESLGQASKMPCPTYSLPAQACKTGQRLAKIPGSVCSGCYADGRGNYRFGNVQATLYARLASLTHPLWVAAMATLIHWLCAASGFMRWHDSGDLQSLPHLEQIAEVARRTPQIRHWLPTREYQIVIAYLKKHGEFPANLTVRISAHMIDGPAPTIRTASARALPVSFVHQHKAPQAPVCPAPEQGNHCRACRRCWTDEPVSYAKH